jgi:thiamine-phosphate pyrophosphorylase
LPSVESRLYAISDRRLCAPRPLLEVVEELLESGVRFFQIREKDLGDHELVHLAAPIVRRCQESGARVLINSSVEVALECGADGVHLPGQGPELEVVRQSGQGLVVGCSVHSLEEACKRQGADFEVYSPIFPTQSKPGYGPVAGLEGLAKVVQSVALPVFALGGVSPERVAQCRRAGAYGVAAMSGLMRPHGAGEQARVYLEELERLERGGA